MSLVSSARAVVADYLRGHIKAARTQYTFLNRLVEKISPQKHFWPPGQKAEYPQGKTLDDWEISPFNPQGDKSHKKSSLERADIWKNQYLKQFRGAHVYDSTVVDKAITQVNKGRPLRALLLLQYLMEREHDRISETLPGTKPDGLIGHGRDEEKHAQNLETLSSALNEHKEALKQIVNTSNNLANYSAATRHDTLQAIELAYEKAMEEVY